MKADGVLGQDGALGDAPMSDAMTATKPTPSTIARAFEQQLARTYQQAVRARAVAENMDRNADAARVALAALEMSDNGRESPMTILATALELTAEQCRLLWSIVVCSFDARIVPHLEALGGAHARRGLSLSVYAQLAELDDSGVTQLAHWLARPNPLVVTGLLLATEHASPAARAYVASARLVSFLAGMDEAIDPLRLVQADRPLSHDLRQSETINEIAVALERARSPVIVIEGPLGSGRATACACASGTTMIVLDCSRIISDQLAATLVVLRRETLLRPGIPVLANVDHVLGEELREQRRLIGEFIDATSGPIVVTTTVPGTDLGANRPVVRIGWDVPDTEVRAKLWSGAAQSIGAAVEGDLASLAFRYRVGPAAIERAVASVHLFHPSGSAVDEAALIAGLRHNIAEKLGGLARRIDVNQTWDDLVLADDTRDLIAALVGRIRHAHQVLDQWGYRKKIARGTGVAALFSGPPGTGKTMVAGLIARELDLELYQVDLSKVVSKWIGETEKNLARVFDAAEEGHALLLFDEADALFGQRSSDMRSATDRYANLEVNYLLQRVEAFGGITILTTNLETAIDEALKRRLAGHVVFAKPDEEERVELWQRQCNTGLAPIANDVDHQELATTFPNMSGANIRNAAISAAFLAAADKASQIRREHLLRAARAEYCSMGYVLTDSLGLKGGRGL